MVNLWLKQRIRLEDVYLPIEASTVPEGQVDSLYNVRKGDIKKGEELEKGD